MAEVINMPRLSDTMEEGTVTKWFKKIGDQVKEGDILAEIETDKATMEFESFQEGELLHIGLSEGDSAPVDSLLAIIGKKGEDISGIINPDSKDKIEQNELDSQKDIDEERDNNDKSVGAEYTEFDREGNTKIFKDLYKGGFELKVHHLPGAEVTIPIEVNTEYTEEKEQVLENCIIDLINNQKHRIQSSTSIDESIASRVG